MEQNEKHKVVNHNTMNNCNVFLGDVYGATFPLPGSQTTVKNYYGQEKPIEEVAKTEPTKQQPAKENVVSDGKDSKPVETREEREKFRREMVGEIIRRFNFHEGRMLGKDHQGKRISNERLGVLFAQCLGVGSHPTQEYKVVMEQLWILLTGKRARANKLPDEGYYRISVMNLLGYFRECGILSGGRMELAKAVFNDADEKLAKQLERGIDNSNAFPRGTSKMMDYYISQLLQGNI